METVCYSACFLSACFALLVGSCHGSIQALRQSAGVTTNYVQDWNNVSGINYGSVTKISDNNVVNDTTRPEDDSRDTILKNSVATNNSYEDNSSRLGLKRKREETTTPLSKGIVTFPVFSKTTESDRNIFATPTISPRTESTIGVEKNDHKNREDDVIEQISKMSGPKSGSLVTDSSELNETLDSRVTKENFQSGNESQWNLNDDTYSQLELNETDENVSDYDTPCDKYLSVVITDYEEFDNGSILATDDYPMLYPPEYVWEDRDQNNTILRGCLCLLTNCLRKCCPENMIYNGSCVPQNDLLQSFEMEFIDLDTKEVIKNNTNDLRTIYGNPCKYGSYRVDPFDDEYPEPFWLSPHGILKTSEGNFSPAEYCMTFFEDVERMLPLLCFPPEEEESAFSMPETNVYFMYPIGMIISLPFLLATFFIYACIHELRNLHGKSLMCHVISLFMAYTFLAVVQLGGDKLEITFCKISAFIIFFAFHASFFWLNVMCFDIWWTFSGLRPLRGSVKEREHKKFVMYSIYAWGSPLIMLVVCLLMDLVPGIPNDYIKPEFGKEKCWFSTKTGDLAYFFGPIGIIVLCNIILFIATAIKLVRLKKETKMLKGVESKRHDDEAERQRFNLYLKLFIVMGVNWIMEVVSWAVGGPEYLWYITDLGNTLQGVLIFVIFVWKRKIRRLLAKKFYPKLARKSIYEGSIRSHPSTSRTSSINNTYRTSIGTQDHLVLKPLPNGAYRVSEIP